MLSQKKKIALLFLLNFFVNLGFGLTVTEMFYRGDTWIDSDERFLELYNDQSTSIDLLSLTIDMPDGSFESGKRVTITSVLSGDFVLSSFAPQTNESLLLPGKYAILTTHAQAKGARLVAFSSNALLLGVSSQSRFESSWSGGRLRLLRIRKGDQLLYSAENLHFPAEEPPRGNSLHLSGNGYRAAPLSAGWEYYSALWADQRLVKEGEGFWLFYSNSQNIEGSVTVQVESLESGRNENLILPFASKGVFAKKVSFSGYVHGATLKLSCGKDVLFLRFQKQRALSGSFQDVVINELIPQAVRDYSTSWDGSDGGGKITDTDEWIELANRGDRDWPITNFYILQQTRSYKTVKPLSLRWGDVLFHPGSYVIVTPSGGLAGNARIVLYQGYPYRDGRIMDELEFGDQNIQGDGIWNNAPAVDEVNVDNEALLRIPNACTGTNSKAIFARGRSTFAQMNEGLKPQVWATHISNGDKIEVFLTDPYLTSSNAMVEIGGSLDKESVSLSNFGIYYRGVCLAGTEGNSIRNDGFLKTANGERLTLSYTNSQSLQTAIGYLDWQEAGWKLSVETGSINNVVVFPNPVKRGETLRLANLPSNAVVRIADPQGKVWAVLQSPQKGALEWNVPREMTQGLLIVLIRQGGDFCVKKLWLQ